MSLSDRLIAPQDVLLIRQAFGRSWNYRRHTQMTVDDVLAMSDAWTASIRILKDSYYDRVEIFTDESKMPHVVAWRGKSAFAESENLGVVAEGLPFKLNRSIAERAVVKTPQTRTRMDALREDMFVTGLGVGLVAFGLLLLIAGKRDDAWIFGVLLLGIAAFLFSLPMFAPQSAKRTWRKVSEAAARHLPTTEAAAW